MKKKKSNEIPYTDDNLLQKLATKFWLKHFIFWPIDRQLILLVQNFWYKCAHHPVNIVIIFLLPNHDGTKMGLNGIIVLYSTTFG